MALTKVAGDILDPGIVVAGIVTATGFSGPFSNGTTGNFSGDVTVGGSLIVQGDQTTLNTTLRNVELLRVAANSATTAGIITQTGSGDILNLFDATTEVMTVVDGGRVGIGLTNPTAKLEVLNNSNIEVLRLKDTHFNKYLTIRGGGSPNRMVIDSYEGGGGGADIDLASNGDTKVRIKSNGKVGINTTTPQTELEVFSDTFSNITIHSARTSGNIGGLDFSNGASAAGIQTAQYFVHTSGHHYWHCNGSERLKLENDGDLTITGVDNAELKLKCGASTGNNILAFLNSAGATKGRILYDSDNSFMVFNTDGTGTERMRITNVGSVGITTSDPHGRLHIHGESGTDIIVLERAGAAGGDSKWGIKPYAKGLYFRSNSDNSSTFNNRDRFALLWDGTDARGSDVAFFGTAAGIASCTWDASANTLKFKDNSKLVLGDGDDLSIYWSGSRAKINSLNSNLDIESDYIALKNQANSKEYLNCTNGGAVKIYFNHAQKFATTDTGISVTGEVASSQDYPTIRPTLDLNFAAVKKLDSRITFRRIGPASYVDEFGKVVLVSGNVPRFDHDPTTRECKGFLIEESRINQWLYSEDFVTYITGGNLQATTLANTTATTDPTGGTNAVLEAATATGGSHSIYKNFTSGSNGDVHTFSVWVKAAGADYARIYVDTVGGNMNGPGVTFSTGNVWNISATGVATQVATSAVEYPNGWWRLSTTGSYSNRNDFYCHIDIEGGEGDISYTGNGSNGIYIWGAQFEAGAFPTSYIPTNGTTATRGKDLAEIDGEEFTDFFNQDEGTINCAYWLGNDNIGMRVFQINDSNNSVIDIVAGSGSGSGGYAYVNTGGTAQANGGQSSTNANYLNKLHVTTLAYKTNDIAGINRNTGVLTNDTSATLDGAYNRVTFYQGANEADQLNGHLQRVQYYPKRLPDNQVKNLNNQ